MALPIGVRWVKTADGYKIDIPGQPESFHVEQRQLDLLGWTFEKYVAWLVDFIDD